MDDQVLEVFEEGKGEVYDHILKNDSLAIQHFCTDRFDDQMYSSQPGF